MSKPTRWGASRLPRWKNVARLARIWVGANYVGVHFGTTLRVCREANLPSSSTVVKGATQVSWATSVVNETKWKGTERVVEEKEEEEVQVQE